MGTKIKAIQYFCSNNLAQPNTPHPPLPIIYPYNGILSDATGTTRKILC